MSDWRASPSLEVVTDRIRELNILAQAAADLERGRPQPTQAASWRHRRSKSNVPRCA
jgi:hypothetical protein